MLANFKPMLGVAAEIDKIRFPALMSPKLDGIRCIIVDGVALSRNLKPIRNRHVQAWVNGHANALQHLDGELIVGEPTDKDVYRNTSSGVMSEDGEPNFSFYVFDHIEMDAPYRERFAMLQSTLVIPRAYIVPHYEVAGVEEMRQLEEQFLDAGYEGAMLRDPNGKYKFGRATVKSGELLKVKRFEDAEALCVGYEELYHNDNEAVKDALGHTKRSTHQENKRPAGTLGALRVVYKGHHFTIGTGFDAATRAELWAQRDALAGRLVKFKFFAIGYECPRFPVFLGFRDLMDA